MRRLLLLLPLCLILAPAAPRPPVDAPPSPPPVPADAGPLPDAAAMERLAREDPLAFIEQCLRRYQREVQGYRARLVKQERLGGKLQPEEGVAVAFREQPYSLLLRWLRGERQAKSILYVADANNGKMLVRPAGLAGLLGVLSRDPEGRDVRRASRYTVKEGGLRDAAERTLRDWRAGLDHGTARIEYEGVQTVPQAGNRPCFTLRRTSSVPEEDGFTEVLIHVDTDTWLQVGSVMTGPEGLYGSYYFRDVELNPVFPPGQFERAALQQ